MKRLIYILLIVFTAILNCSDLCSMPCGSLSPAFLCGVNQAETSFFLVFNKKYPQKLQDTATFCIFAPMRRKVLTYGGYFEAFMTTLNEKEQEKIQYGLLLLKSQERLSKKFVKHIRNGIYELRTDYGGNIYRVFFIFDDGQIVVLFNGFQKKTQKTPTKEIEKAIKIKEAYYADKQSQNR